MQHDSAGTGDEGRRRIPISPVDLLPDLQAGLTVALVSIPEGMAYALVAGVDPIYGLNTGMVTTVVAAATDSTSRLIVTLTNALELVAGDALADLSGEVDPISALFTLTFMVGAMMTALGALRLGGVIRFVSREVMAGFVFVTALLVVLGQVRHLLGAQSASDGGRLLRALDVLSRPADWSIPRAAVGAASILVLVVLKRTRLRGLADVLVIAFPPSWSGRSACRRSRSRATSPWCRPVSRRSRPRSSRT